MNLITTTSRLSDFCKRAAHATYITVDTEFVRETTYWPQLCLIQVGLENEAAIIDPLAKDIDMSAFFDLLQHPNITKVFHSGRQDIEIFYHLTEQIPAPVFDTQIAAMVCGFGESVGYDVLVQKYAKVSIDKSSRYTHWAQRPLSEKQLSYALGDVTHLRIIYEKLMAKIVEEDRLHWLHDELAVLTSPTTYAIDPYTIWQKIRVKSPKPRFLAILRELAAWREFTAQRRNVPRGRVLRDEFMLELAASAPTTVEDLKRMRGIPSSIGEGKEKEEILRLVKKAQDLPLEDCPQVPRRSELGPGSTALIEMLRLLLKIESEKYHVAQKLIATTDDLERIARGDENVPALLGWRREVFGNSALALKEGRIALGLKNNRITLLSLD